MGLATNKPASNISDGKSRAEILIMVAFLP
jgi:hypothetical protein